MVVSDTFLLDKTYVHVVVDLGASHSFMTPEFTKKLSRNPIEIAHKLCVAT